MWNGSRLAAITALPLVAVLCVEDTTASDEWPNIHVVDPYTRDAVVRAVQGASERLARPKCQTLFQEFHDERNLGLTAKLRDLGTDPQGYLRMVFFGTADTPRPAGAMTCSRLPNAAAA